MKQMSNEFVVAQGARFRVLWKCSMSECREFEGVYKGMSAIGSDTALVFDVDGVLRFLSAQAVVCMDQLEAAPEAPQERKSDAGSVFYG